MHFVTRERIHVDRISTAWAIRRFIDPDATFEFVPWTRDVREMPGIAFDMRGGALSHHKGRCTLEALIARYEIADPALRRMALIIRAADLPQEDPAPAVAAGVLAIFDGIRDGSTSDEERLERGSVVCDALYTYCQQAEDVASDRDYAPEAAGLYAVAHGFALLHGGDDQEKIRLEAPLQARIRDAIPDHDRFEAAASVHMAQLDACDVTRYGPSRSATPSTSSSGT